MARSSFRKDNGKDHAVRAEDANRDIVQQALQRLSQYEHIQVHSKSIVLNFRDGVLTASGTLPTYYLKQVLQTILRDMPGVVRIDNRVVVAPFSGPHEGNSSYTRNSHP